MAKQLLPSPVGTGEPGPELVFTGSSSRARCGWALCMEPLCSTGTVTVPSDQLCKFRLKCYWLMMLFAPLGFQLI